MLHEFYDFLDRMAERAARQVEQDPQAKNLTREQWAAKVAQIATSMTEEKYRELAKVDPEQAAWFAIQMNIGLEMHAETRE